MNLLGINSVYHETAAALIMDGQVCSAVEEERFNRRKHGAEATVHNPDELPVESIRYCLKQAHLRGNDLDAVCFSFNPNLRQQEWQADPYALPGDWGHPEGEKIFQTRLSKIPEAISELLQFDVTDRFHWVSHHLAHAASAFYPAGFGQANILVADGIGEYATTLLATGENHRINALKHFYYPNSIGFLWEKFSKFLGFSEYDAAKVMGLAGYGNAEIYRQSFEQIISYHDGSFEINDQVLQFRQPAMDGLLELFGPIDYQRSPGHSQKSRDLAATLQDITNAIRLGLANHLYQLHPCEALCLAGGVALNCQGNQIIKEQSAYQQVYIPPASHDAGTALGAALYTYYHSVAGKQRKPGNSVVVMPNPYTGPNFTDEEILSFLQTQPVSFRASSHVTEEAAQYLAQGKIVGWFQGRMELGPRALGNRSLLADPRHRNIRVVLNEKVKHREEFRPFAPSVLEEYASDWFEIGKPSESYRFMLFACPVKPDKVNQIPAVIHVDNTARAQLVSRTVNPKYHELISHFAKLTGVPMVLNTSFNDCEPIVCTPQDAFHTFCNTMIDVLVMGNYLIERKEEVLR